LVRKWRPSGVTASLHFAVVDWSILHALNGSLAHHEEAQDTARIFNAWAIFVLAALAGGTWFVARPNGSNRSKLAAVSAVLSGAVALLLNAALGSLWFHDRPFVDHPRADLLLIHHAADNSFPSDHTSVAFGIAFAVLAFHRRLGTLLVLTAAAIGFDRMLVGVHYPVDVATSVLVGLAAAALVVTAGRPTVNWLVRQLSRLSDPLVGRARRLHE
jgi:undecaprenyl-diphosphatase